MIRRVVLHCKKVTVETYTAVGHNAVVQSDNNTCSQRHSRVLWLLKTRCQGKMRVKPHAVNTVQLTSSQATPGNALQLSVVRWRLHGDS